MFLPISHGTVKLIQFLLVFFVFIIWTTANSLKLTVGTQKCVVVLWPLLMVPRWWAFVGQSSWIAAYPAVSSQCGLIELFCTISFVGKVKY